MKCPNCNVSWATTDRNGIEIDYCPEYRGVWLDRGEIDTIIERSSSGEKNFDPGKLMEHRKFSKESDYRYKKREGFLGELFDF